VVSFIRRHENEEVLVLHNVSDIEVTVRMDEAIRRFNTVDYFSEGEKLSIEDNQLRVPAYSTVILKQN
jgi:hypothetical protein